MAVLYRLFLTVISLCLTFAVFLTKQEVALLDNLNTVLQNTPNMASYLCYFLVVIFLARISLCIASRLSDEEIPAGSISALETANDAFLPSYLGYFFVALSIPNYNTFIFVFSIICIFTFFSQAAYFNPAYLLLGWHFYYATDTGSKTKILLITKKKLRDPSIVEFKNIKRINDLTFIDMEA